MSYDDDISHVTSTREFDSKEQQTYSELSFLKSVASNRGVVKD